MSHDDAARQRYEAVKEALEIYVTAGGPQVKKVEWRQAAIRRLARHGMWSLAHIQAITGVGMKEVRRTVTKSDHTGGRFNPATLSLIVEEFDMRQGGGVNDALTTAIVDMGTSPLLLSRILGVSVGRIRAQLARYQRESAAAGPQVAQEAAA